MIIRVFLYGSRSQFCDITIGSETTCSDVILSIIEDVSRSNCFVLTELCMGYERVIDNKEQPFEILQQWGNHADKVQFFLRQKVPAVSVKGQEKVYKEQLKCIPSEHVQPDVLVGTEYSVNKLVEMAGKQKDKLVEQHQIFSDKALLVSALHLKQKRCKDQTLDRNQRLATLHELVNEKEAKFKKLQLLKNLADSHTKKNADLINEIDMMKCRFEKKEQELVSVIEKMETLTKKLKKYRKEHSSHLLNDVNFNFSSKKEILKEQIMKYNHQNSQNTQLLHWNREILVSRQQQVADFIDKVNNYRARLNSTEKKMQQMMNQDQQISNSHSVSEGEEMTADRSPMMDDTKCKTLPHSLKFSDVKLFNRCPEVLCHSKISDIGDDANISDKSSLSLSMIVGKIFDIDTLEFSAQGNLQQASDIKMSSKYGKMSEITEVSAVTPTLQTLSTSSAVVASLVSSTTANRHSSHLLMSHFAPRPYESKYSFARFVSQPTILPSSNRGPSSAIGLTDTIKTIDYSNEIIISDPPSKIPAGQVSASSFSNIQAKSVLSTQFKKPSIHFKDEFKCGLPLVPPSDFENEPYKVDGHASNFAFLYTEISVDRKVKEIQQLNNNVVRSVSAEKHGNRASNKQLAQDTPTIMPLPKCESALLKESCLNDDQAGEMLLSGLYFGEEKSVLTMKAAGSQGPSPGKLGVRNIVSSNLMAPVDKLAIGEKTSEKSLLVAVQPVGGKDIVFGSDVEKPVRKPVVPRPVRRRMSSGDMSEDYMNRIFHQTRAVKIDVTDDFPLPVCPDHEVKAQFVPGFDSCATDANSVETKDGWSSQPFRRQGNLKRTGKPKLLRRVSFEPLALLLDASLEGELDLVEKTALEVPDISASNDEGITALHNAICAGHFDIVKFLVQFGCDINSPDSDGWTPLHCAASCNNLTMTQFLVEHGACIFATTFSDQELACDKCEEDEEGYDTCCQYLQDVQDKMGFVNDAIIYAVFDYEAENPDELNFCSGDCLVVLRKGDNCEQEWWWCRLENNEGYVPRNLVGLFPRVVPASIQSHQQFNAL